MPLVNDLIESGYLKTPLIINSFRKIKRADFVSSELKELSEADSPLPIGFGQTISQPLTVAFMMELLKPEKGDIILDVGSGSGWTVALLSEMVAPGKVYGLELIPELCSLAVKNIKKYNFIDKKIASVSCGDGWKGLPLYAPFDKIIVAAAAVEMPHALLDQLKIGGKLVVPIGSPGMVQNMVLAVKTGKGEYQEQLFPGFSFVPLVKKDI